MARNHTDTDENTGLPNGNPIRNQLKSRNSTDFTSATLRRLALMHRARSR
ncbi:hypothetical protein [Bacillus sp. CECT 9360]|nr:hypothetical protein [Bacillus sp. CECT 9360]CAH0344126.1 hypothetical protein BCI9360_00357 [Bacillus sp. CECT 9360]